jgi:hypothetical protein
MNKFKVGDRVLRKFPEFDYMYMEAGKVYTVTEVFGPEDDEHLYVDGKSHFWDADYFELYVEPEEEHSPSELEEAYARIDSLEELVTELSQELREETKFKVSLTQQANTYSKMVNALYRHRSFQFKNGSTYCEELLATIKLLQDSYDNKENK